MPTSTTSANQINRNQKLFQSVKVSAISTSGKLSTVNKGIKDNNSKITLYHSNTKMKKPKALNNTGQVIPVPVNPTQQSASKLLSKNGYNTNTVVGVNEHVEGRSTINML